MKEVREKEGGKGGKKDVWKGRERRDEGRRK
jgi:hypothetical protein